MAKKVGFAICFALRIVLSSTISINSFIFKQFKIDIRAIVQVSDMVYGPHASTEYLINGSTCKFLTFVRCKK